MIDIFLKNNEPLKEPICWLAGYQHKNGMNIAMTPNGGNFQALSPFLQLFYAVDREHEYLDEKYLQQVVGPHSQSH